MKSDYLKLFKRYSALLLLIIMCAACGISDDEEEVDPSTVSGPWFIILTSTSGSATNEMGFIDNTPIQIDNVAQDNANISATFDLDQGAQGMVRISLSGFLTGPQVIFTLLDPGTIMGTISAVLQGRTMFGQYGANALDSSGYSEQGTVVISIGATDTAAVGGTWTISLSGTAEDCVDAGPFTKTWTPVTVFQSVNSLTSAPFDATHVLSGTVAGNAFVGAVINSAPTATTTMMGEVNRAGRTIAGSIAGTLALSIEACTVSGSFVAVY